MANRYWVGGTDNWYSGYTTPWSATSGGTGGASVPTSSDNVYFDANSGTVTVTVAGTMSCNQLITTGFTGTLDITGGAGLSIYGNTTIGSSTNWGTGWSSNLKSLVFTGGNKSLDFGGTVFPYNFVINQTVGTTATLTNNLSLSGSITLQQGGFDAATYNVSVKNISSSYTSIRSLTLGSGTWTLSDSSSPISITATNLSFSAGTSTIVLSGTAAGTTRTVFSSASLTFYNMVLGGGAATTATTSFNRGYTFNTLSSTLSVTHTVLFQQSVTTTVSNFNISGSSGNLISIASNSSGTQATLSKSSGVVSTSYLSIKDSNATGGATWNTFASVNVSNNTGWNFTYPDVTVNVTKVTGTGAVGTVVVPNAYANATGLSATARLGTVVVQTNTAIATVTGVQGTGAVGTIDVLVTADPILPLGYNVILISTLGASTWTVPADWNNANNKIECIGSGSNGTYVSVLRGKGGNGGAYAKNTNVSLTPGATVYVNVGPSNSTTDTWVNTVSNAAPSSTVQGVLAKSGRNGGTSAASIGTTKYSGGLGQTGFGAGGGGGGAGGPLGNGAAGGAGGISTGAGGAGGGGANNGTVGADAFSGGVGAKGGNSGTGAIGGSGGNSTTVAGNGVDGSGGGGGSPYYNIIGANGGNGYTTYISGSFNTNTPFTGVLLAGPGGGAGGNGSFTSSTTIPCGAGGIYGGGGGGIATPTVSSIRDGGSGGQGLVVITYAPAYITNNLTGVQANTTLGSVAVWIGVDDQQANNWVAINDSQVDNWTHVITSGNG